MGHIKYFLLIAFLVSLIRNVTSQSCEMEGIGNWGLVPEPRIWDTHRGVVFSRSTTNIQEINNVNTGDGVNALQYLDISMQDSNFTIRTTPAFELYEENETSSSMGFSVIFLCASGSTNTLVFQVHVDDTNNNPPTFRPSNEFEFTITPPLPPGFQITSCGDDIVVRDIDLTTQMINFNIQENPYFEIAYNGRSSADPKEFLAVLRTKDLIRTLPEVVELTVSATDVDNTGDPPITTTATIRIQADDQYQFPDEPVFSQPFYLATYTNDNQLIIPETISLQQGFDEEVTFNLEGEHVDYFSLSESANQITISVRNPVSTDILKTGQVILVVRAERLHTTGATTTVIVQLPEVPDLEFGQTQYDGRIVDNVLQPIELNIIQGYEEGFDVGIYNEYASFFAANVQGNVVTLSMTPLNSTIIDSNNFITLQVVASNQFSSTTAVVTFDVIKDDNVTPVFDNALYTGDYSPETGLSIQQISLVQGYDEGVLFSLQGEHENYFQISNVGPVITLTTSGVPPELWQEQQLLLALEATKPRSVAATAAISIRLPSARNLVFESATYRGTIQKGTLTLQPIVLTAGHSEDVNFTLSGEYLDYFSVSNIQNQVTINVAASLPNDVILENNFLTLTLTASGVHTIPVSAVVVLEIIKEDITTPVFSENIYRAVYLVTDIIELGNISLAQGYDSTVTFALDGDHSEYFRITNIGNNLNLDLLTPIPVDVIFNEKVLLFNVLANKPLTVGANAAVSVTFPLELTDATVMRFSQNSYVGSIQENTLTLGSIVLETGYESGTNFSLTGEYAPLFLLDNVGNAISISIANILPDDLIRNNSFIVLEIEANRERAISTSASIIIDVIDDEIIPPVFSKAFYRGVYADNELQFKDIIISLSHGYDDTITFNLEGEHATWFAISQNENAVNLILNTSVTIPEDILEYNSHLLFTIVARKPEAINGNAAISIDLPKEIPDPLIMRFTQSSYVGRIDNGELYAPVITLLGDRDPIQLNLTGDFASYFELSHENNDVQLRLINNLPDEIIELAFIILDIEASYPEAYNGYTAIVLEIIKQPQPVTPVFEQAYYIGEYSDQGGLYLEQPIRMIQGYDESVLFTLTGDDAQWFELVYNDGNNLTLSVRDSALGQIRNRSHVFFSVLATKPESVAGSTAVIISLTDLTTAVPLRFLRHFYSGTIENNSLTISDIHLVEGYSADMNVSFIGDHVDFFQLTNQEGIFTLRLISDLPFEIIEDNNVLLFTLEVQIDDTIAHTTVILELIKTKSAPLAFEEAYYVGSYSFISGFAFDLQISLTEYNDAVSFSLEGDNSQWFAIIENQYPVVLTQVNPIPVDILSNNVQLIFVIVAERPENMTTRSTIIIKIIDDTTILDFERNVYLGSIQNNTADIDGIILSNGHSANVSFTLIGDLQSYFYIDQTQDGMAISVALQNEIPDELIPQNRIISLELQASAPQAISAYATLVFRIAEDVIEQLIFNAPYYTGTYTVTQGLEFLDVITLSEGYDENVQFALEGDSATYFTAVVSNNSVSLELVNPIPQPIVINNQQLIFTIQAVRPYAFMARSIIVISLIDDVTEDLVLGFDQIAYLGSIEDNTVNLIPITLSVGFTENVIFTLYGDLVNYFNISNLEGNVTISLPNPIPEESIPDNRIIILELQAAALDVRRAYATIILHIVEEVIELPEFDKTYYIGHFTQRDGLTFESPITLSEGYDENIQFTLEGVNSQYFEAVTLENSVTLRVIAPIPNTTVLNDHHLIFNIRADKPGMSTVRAPIIISLLDVNLEELVLRFDQITYQGFIENNTVTLDEITLDEGFSPDVSFTLHGDFKTYFNLTVEEASLIITLNNPIPEELILDNGIIILEVQASASQMVSTYATIILRVVNEIIEPLIFSEIYYTGHYTEADGLTFENNITLLEGYSEHVKFSLEGDSSVYFEAEVSGNSVSLRLVFPIPSSVAINNQHLIFVIHADKPNAVSARATLIITLLDVSTDVILSFEHLTYLGAIENGTANIENIILSDGYNQNVSFTLYGNLSDYFSLFTVEEIVTISLQNQIPEELIPVNRVLILELHATAPEAISAFATVIFNVIEEDIENAERLTFSETYYTGSYIESIGLIFEETILLSGGYNENVQFSLEGDSAQYFEALISENAVSLRVALPIPSAVILNNPHLIFMIRADKTGSLTTRATIVISLLDELNMDHTLGFDRITYSGSFSNNTVNLDPITLNEGYTQNVSFILYGDLSRYFTVENTEATVFIQLQNPIPEELMPNNNIILLEVHAVASGTMSTNAVIVLEVVQNETIPNVIQLIFSKTFYTGHHIEGALTFEETITLTEGYDENVQFVLEGGSSQYFEVVIISPNSASLTLVSPIPPATISNNQQLIFSVRAERPDAVTASATIVISLIDERSENIILGFDRITYVGAIANNIVNISAITLREGFTPDVSFNLFGDLVSFFGVSNEDSAVTITLLDHIPEELIPDNRIIILELQASAPEATSAQAAIVFEVIQENSIPNIEQLIFSETYYSGYYTEEAGLTFVETITLTYGYDGNVDFSLEGDNAQYFEVVILSANLVSLRLIIPIPPAVVTNNQQLIFTIHAERANALSARATIVIGLINEIIANPVLLFSQISYTGSIENNLAHIEPIVLSQGYSEAVNFTLQGNLAEYFTRSFEGPIVTIVLLNVIPEQLLPSNRIILLHLQAFAPDTMSAYATIVFEVVQDEVEDMAFSRPFYTGQYSEDGELSFNEEITLSQGFDETVSYFLEGEYSEWFTVLQGLGNSVSITLDNTIPHDVLENNRKLIFFVGAWKPGRPATRSTVVISIINGNQNCTPDDGARFEKLLFEGILQGGIVRHETISLTGYNGTNIQIRGEYAELFEVVFEDEVLTVQGVGSVILSTDVAYLTLELQAGSASAILLLQVIHSENPLLPLVTFSAPSYIVMAEISQIGFIGRVQASADNGEPIVYSLDIDDAHLLQRVSINNEGELYLLAPVNTGVNIFNVVGTTAFSQARGTATVHLTVEAITVCGDDNLVLPPLMTLDRDEESPHENLVVLNTTEFAGCRYRLTNRWPIDQSWLYVDENGLHTTAIDREHVSIAFMALSQVQVELMLECDNDVTTRAKRSVNIATRRDHLEPYDYGDNKWILTDTILHNPRRSLVNLIVNDINDNVPIFNGKENEPIVVGYPIADLEDRILPRALAEVQATDADVGENAALVYWSSEDVLAVSPHSGFVHVRNNAQLEDNAILTINATDRNGQGLTGSLDLMVKLVDTNHIAVVTIRQAFLDDERAILANMSAGVGYEVKALRSTVISDSESVTEEQRKKRQAITSAGASLQLYVYGLIERDPVDVQQLTEDISTSAITVVNIGSTVSLEDYLESLEICSLPGHDTALFVSTIVLSVLLFILIVVAAVWFFLRWRRKQKYEQFSDDNSIETQTDVPPTRPKLIENVSKPRMNLEDLKKSERRLQEMLDNPLEGVPVQPAPTMSQKQPEAKVSIPEPPIVIQSIDKLKDVDGSEDEDEFGEKARGKRKSVVTFNENVEKIIHVEDTPDDAEYEVYKL